MTEFEFRLHATGTQALTVELGFPLDEAGAVLRGWRDLSTKAPRPATFTAAIGNGLATVGYVWVDATSYVDLQRRDNKVAAHEVDDAEDGGRDQVHRQPLPRAHPPDRTARLMRGKDRRPSHGHGHEDNGGRDRSKYGASVAEERDQPLRALELEHVVQRVTEPVGPMSQAERAQHE